VWRCGAVALWRNRDRGHSNGSGTLAAVKDLEASEWLRELAARDDPPTELEPLLERLGQVGVDLLEGGSGGHLVSGAQADSIVALGRGVSASATLDPVPAPVAAALKELADALERFDRLRRLRLAAIDMRLAERAAEALADREGPARLFERVLETGLVVTYARPYLHSNRAGLTENDAPTDEDGVGLHDELVTLRHQYHAHADRTNHRTLIDTTGYLGVNGPPRFAEMASRLSELQLARLADLARRQAERFEAEAARIGVELGEQPGDAGNSWSL
jgi:hypothetical protein